MSSFHESNGASIAPGNGSARLTDHESAVLERYVAGAQAAQPELCCPVRYEKKYLEALPAEIIEKDYGCGDPSAHVRAGERVLDLGSGGGKICYILAQKVGASGSVVGVDFNDEMLGLARKYQAEMAEKLGYGNVDFRKGKIQDLALDLDRVESWLRDRPVRSVEEMNALQAECDRLRREEPLVPDESVDVVVSNCVLNLVRPQDKEQLFREIHRVLKRGGRAVISDIVSDEDPTPSILADAELWSGCIAGAFREDAFLEMFEDAGFYGIQILERQAEPWQVVEGVEFRSLTLCAYKGKEGPCMERNQAVVYGGPWKAVTDDDGHTLYRGRRMAVCDKTYALMTDANGPYAKDILPVPPLHPVPEVEVAGWDSQRPELRHPRETKGLDYDLTTSAEGNACCGPDCC